MNYNIAKPSAGLSAYVKHFWSMESHLPNNKEHIQRIVPSGLMELIFYFDDKPISNDNSKSISETCLITGQLNNYYDLKVSGKISLFSIIFKPHGLAAFIDIPISEVYDKNVPLKYIFKDRTNEIEDKLFNAKTFNNRIQIAEKYLFDILLKKERKHNITRINKSINIINNSKAFVDINNLASEVCFSRRQFERNFSNIIGTSPKKFLRIIRFQNALDKKSKSKNISLSELTYECGYYDQAHMINDFQKLSGLSPKEYFNQCEPYSDYFQ